MTLLNIRRLHANNVATFRKSPLSEISGSLGDLGTLLPLMIALAVNNSISLSTTLVFSGLWNIVTGVWFGIPLPVQPMKAIAAVAIARKFSREETVSAGFTTSGVVFLFSVSGLLKWFTRVIPIPVVKGIQVGAGLSLVLSAGTNLLNPLGWTTPNAEDNLTWVLFAFIALLVTQKMQNVPYALLIFILGLILSLSIAGGRNLPFFSIWQPSILVPSRTSFKTGALDAGLGQIPLTTLNSIIAVSYLSADLLPNIPTPGVTEIGISVALMNLIAGWFGAMPIRVNLLQYRTHLLLSTLHCENEDVELDLEHTIRNRARAAGWYFVERGTLGSSCRAASPSPSTRSVGSGNSGQMLGPGYARHEIEGIGGVVKKKLVRMVKVGACVPECGDERDAGTFLVKEQEGVARSWCGWCWRVVPGVEDLI
ncbi:sulfate transporter, partial [Diplocarpon rosae]